MSSFDLEALLSLFSVQGIGPARMRKLISVFSTPEAVLQASVRQLCEVDGIDIKTAEKIKTGVDEDFVRRQMQQIRRFDVRILSYWDSDYPAKLKSIYDPPVFLFYLGNVELLTSSRIAIVGTRVPTAYGRAVTERLTRELVQNGFTIISGFARGVDTVAHKTALKNGGSTIAVLGNGLDYIYPPENKKLFDLMIGQDLFLSEYAMGTKPDAGNFPKRNRIISGMSEGVLVTEAGEKSGALITALYANDQNREVFAVPGAITSGKSSGTNRLIKSGAKLVQSVEDILEELGGQIGLDFTRPEAPAELDHLSPSQKRIYDMLGAEPIHVDQLAYRTELSPAETLSALLTLELYGLVRQMAGKMFIRL